MIKNGKFAINPQFEWTGGGMVSNAEDLARWAKAMYEGKAFDATLLPQMLDGVSAPMLGRETKYGLGVIIRPTRAGLTYGHSGFFPGYMTDDDVFSRKENRASRCRSIRVFHKISENLWAEFWLKWRK